MAAVGMPATARAVVVSALGLCAAIFRAALARSPGTNGAWGPRPPRTNLRPLLDLDGGRPGAVIVDGACRQRVRSHRLNRDLPRQSGRRRPSIPQRRHHRASHDLVAEPVDPLGQLSDVITPVESIVTSARPFPSRPVTRSWAAHSSAVSARPSVRSLPALIAGRRESHRIKQSRAERISHLPRRPSPSTLDAQSSKDELDAGTHWRPSATSTSVAVFYLLGGRDCAP